MAAHDDHASGSCPLPSQSTLRTIRECRLENGQHIATLADLLRLPLSEWFIDLKTTQSDDATYITAVINEVVSQIKKYNRQDGAVIMIYNAPQSAVGIIKSNGIRAGLKGYPRTKEQVKGMIDTANRIGFEMTCVSEHLMDQDLLAYSKKMNIWQLPWTAARPNPERWQKMVDWGGLVD